MNRSPTPRGHDGRRAKKFDRQRLTIAFVESAEARWGASSRFARLVGTLRHDLSGQLFLVHTTLVYTTARRMTPTTDQRRSKCIACGGLDTEFIETHPGSTARISSETPGVVVDHFRCPCGASYIEMRWAAPAQRKLSSETDAA